MWNEWRFSAQVLPEFGHPVPTLAYRNHSGVNLAMFVFNPNNRNVYLAVRKMGKEEVQSNVASRVTGKVRLLPVFTPLPKGIASPRQIFKEQEFYESELTYSLNLGKVTEDSNVMKTLTLLKGTERFFLLGESDRPVFEIEAGVELQEARSFIAFCIP